MLNKKKIKNNLNTIFSLLDQKKVKFLARWRSAVKVSKKKRYIFIF